MKRWMLSILLCLALLTGCRAAPAATAKPKPAEYPEGEVALEWLAMYLWVDEYDPSFHLVFDAAGSMAETDGNTGATVSDRIEICGEDLYRVSAGHKELCGRIYMKDRTLYIERDDEISAVSYVIE